MNKNWYVIQVISGTEENVKKSLFQRRESFWLEDYIIDVFVPNHDVIVVQKWWKQVKRSRNIFPGYILVEMVVTNESWYIVRNTPNVTWFLGAWNTPVPVSPEELEKLKWVLSEKSETFDTKYKVGDYAIITKWPFEWNEWRISELNVEIGTLKLNINLLWRDTPVELSLDQIKVSEN